MTVFLRAGASLAAVLLVVSTFPACRSIPTADAVLAGTGEASPDPSAVIDPAAALVVRADEAARAALEVSRAEGAGPRDWIAAGRALFTAADLRMQAAVIERFEGQAAGDPSALIDAEDALPGELRAEVGGLCREARSAASRALESLPEEPAVQRAEARLVEALGDALGAWADGPSRALFGGAAGRIPAKLEALASDAPDLEGAAPLRLRGRFLRRAPWPTRDRPAGRELLERAAELAPTPLNLMFLGDAQWVDGDAELARASWERAALAEADPLTELAAPLVRRLSARRAEAAGR